MKYFTLFFSLLFFTHSYAQLENLPQFEDIDGVSKTVVNEKLYPLLLKVNISETENAENLKKLISNLNYFEVYDSIKEHSAKLLLENVSSYVELNNYKNLSENTFERINQNQKEFIIVKRGIDSTDTATVFVFTTKLNYNFKDQIKFM